MAVVKPYRQLILTTPYIPVGRDVRQIQTALNTELNSRGVKLLVDGQYGEGTASAVAKWKYIAGYPKPNNGLGLDGQKYLLHLARLPLAYRAIAKIRATKNKPAPVNVAKQMRLNVMALMRIWAKNGIKEIPAQSNKVPVLQQLAAQLGLSKFYQAMGWPWCTFCIFVAAWKYKSKTAWHALIKGAFNGLYTVDVLNKAAAGRYGMRIIGKSERQPGDIALINFPGGDLRVDHAAVFVEALSRGYIRTVEGNTSFRGSQDNGGAFCERTDRHEDLVRAYIRYE